MDSFDMRITCLVNNLRTLGDTVEEVRVVQKFLREVPGEYGQIACSIETLLDLNNLSVEELIRRLRSVAQRCNVDTTPTTGGQILLVEEQWLARGKQREQGQGSSSGSGKGKYKGKGKPSSQGRDGGQQGGGRGMSKVKCYNCNKYANHFSRVPSRAANARSVSTCHMKKRVRPHCLSPACAWSPSR
jgi:hypothetical protein